MIQQTTIETAIWALWARCLLTARAVGVGYVTAAPVETLIRESRSVIAAEGYSQRDSDLILFDIYTRIHWDWQQPTDRLFETLLEFELEGFFKERGKADA